MHAYTAVSSWDIIYDAKVSYNAQTSVYTLIGSSYTTEQGYTIYTHSQSSNLHNACIDVQTVHAIIL